MARRWLVATTEYAGLTPYTGGIGRHYAALLPALVAAGDHVDLLVYADGPARDVDDLGGVNLAAYRRTDALDRTRALRARALDVRRHHLRGRHDRVFLPEWGGLGAALPRRAPLLTNLATSMRLANEIAGLRRGDLPRDIRRPVATQERLESRQIRRSAGLIAISHAMLARVREDFGTLPPAEVVGNCIDVDGVRVAAAVGPLPEAWPAGGAPVVLFLGRSERRKGVVEGVRAFGALHARVPEARLVLAGAGGDDRFEPSRAELLALLSPAAAAQTTWLGHVEGDSLYRAMHEAAAVMCPSPWEGFGNVALEVKAAGAPLVVTSGSGFDDFCVDGLDCLMVPPRDETALAEALHRLLTSAPLATSLTERAAERVGDYAPAPVAAALIGAADRLLAGRRGDGLV
jgi:glycogen(starch) synthase